MGIGGMEMLLKSIGLDPQKILAEFGEGFNAMKATVEEIGKRLERIEQKLDSLAVEAIDTAESEGTNALSKITKG